jgi:putative inorganic carbon (hco3(-)) transporter
MRTLPERNAKTNPAARFLGTLKAYRPKASGAYKALMALSLLYFLRPEDVIPGLVLIPWAKIAGGVALIAVITTLMSGKTVKRPAELKLLVIFWVWYLLAVPMAYWKGGALSYVLFRLSKCVIVVFLVTVLCDQFWMVKRLVWVQAMSVALMTVASVAVHHTQGGRLTGVLGGVFENPNDLAINIALNWPLCIAFLFMSSRAMYRMLWLLAIVVMIFAVEMTYSRTGFVALGLAGVLVLWEFGVRGKRRWLIGVAMLLIGLVMVAAPGNYTARIASIVTGNDPNSLDKGSREARKELLIASIQTALHNPILGVGAAGFQASMGHFKVAHNTYTEIAADAGFPAVTLFIAVIVCCFRNLRVSRTSEAYNSDKDVKILIGGLWVSLAAYCVSAFFASTEFSLYPYFVFGYTIAIRQTTLLQDTLKSGPKRPLWLSRLGEKNYADEPTKQLAEIR